LAGNRESWPFRSFKEQLGFFEFCYDLPLAKNKSFKSEEFLEMIPNYDNLRARPLNYRDKR
jgi:hypothetical protein